MKTNSLYIGFFILACLCGCRASQKANHEGKDFRVLGIDLEANHNMLDKQHIANNHR